MFEFCAGTKHDDRQRRVTQCLCSADSKHVYHVCLAGVYNCTLMLCADTHSLLEHFIACGVVYCPAQVYHVLFWQGAACTV